MSMDIERTVQVAIGLGLIIFFEPITTVAGLALLANAFGVGADEVV